MFRFSSASLTALANGRIMQMVKAQSKRVVFVSIGTALVGIALVILPFVFGKPEEEASDLVRFFGRFHPVVLHLPIGVFALLLLQEKVAIVMRQKPQFHVLPSFFAAATAVVAVIFGFLLYQGGGYEGELVEDHLWGGIIFACLSLVTFVMRYASAQRKGASIWPYRGMLFLTVVVMGIASHDGASITHGEDYLFKYAPDPLRKIMGLEPKPKPKEREKSVPIEQQLVYADVIQPILEASCVQCHKEGKSKGRFRMDTYDFLLEGGKEGDGLIPGDAKNSNVVFRIELPEDDEEHMPPEGKKDLEAHELVLLKWWIDQGASPDKKVGELEMTEAVVSALKAWGAAPEEVEADSAATLSLPNDELIAAVGKFNDKYPASLFFESQEGDHLVFSAASMRQKMTSEEFSELEVFFPYLVELDLTATGLGDESIARLQSAPRLKRLRLGETAISNTCLEFLVGLKNLQSLNLYGTDISDEAVPFLQQMKALEKLYIWNTNLTKAGVAELLELQQKLEIIGAPN